MIAITPKRASAKRPSSSIRTKKTPMIALKRVKTLPATMLETEREEVSGGGAEVVEPLRGLGAREAGGAFWLAAHPPIQ